MQTSKEKPTKNRPNLKAVVEVLAKINDWVERAMDYVDERMAYYDRTLTVLRKHMQDDQASGYRMDQYLLGGTAVVDLVLITVILPLGVSNPPLFIALLSLVISLVAVPSALYVGFVKSDVEIAAYGAWHATVIAIAEVSTVVALIATVWHISSLIGAIFLLLVIAATILCFRYYVSVRLDTANGGVSKPAPTPTNPDSSESNISSDTASC